MGKTTGFLEFERRDRGSAPVHERVRHWAEFAEAPPHQEVSRQSSRCMDRGIPFCHTGCPVNNLIPDWTDIVSRSDWPRALERLHLTNNFRDFTCRFSQAHSEPADKHGREA